MSRRLALLVLAVIWPLPSFAAASAAEEIAGASARVAAAAKVLEAAEAAPDQVAELGRAIADYEVALAALRRGVAEAGAQKEALALDLADRRPEISRLLAALEVMSLTSQPVPALHPQGPLAAARASAMLVRLTPALRTEAQALARQVADLQAARRLHAEASEDLAAALAALNKAHAALAAAMADSVPEPEGPASPTLTMMARQSISLTALAAALAGSADAPAPPAASSEALGWPVAGTVSRHFNEPDAAGVRRPGVVLEAPPLALVTAPADAVVRYAGPFLEYGYVVVLEPDADTMVVLAGLARLHVQSGTSVHRGDPLGLLGGRAPNVEEYVMLPDADSGAGSGETLYIEVRQGRGPVDPEPLFAGKNG